MTYTRELHRINELWGCIDADSAGDTDTRWSRTGHTLIMNGGPISCKSRRQYHVSLSTSEAEFITASQASQEIVYLLEILRDFGYIQTVLTFWRTTWHASL